MTSIVFLDTASKVARAAMTGTALPSVSAKLLAHLNIIAKFFDGDEQIEVDAASAKCVIKAKLAPTSAPALIDTTGVLTGSGNTAAYSFEWDSADSVELRAVLDAAADPTQPQEMRCEIEYAIDNYVERIAFPIFFDTSYTRPEDPAPNPSADASFTWLRERFLAGANVIIDDDGHQITITAPVTNGTDGDDGREIELQVTGTHIQWRYVGAGSWTNLVALSTITGPAGSNGTNGSSVELQVTSTHIQWRLVGAGSWTNLVALSTITGPAGSNGWSPQFAVVSDGARRVLQLTGWTGGSGSDPGSINYYVGTTGLVSAIGDAIDIRGEQGEMGGSGVDGAPGSNGSNGWSPQFAVVSDGARRVLQLTGWTGGSGGDPGSINYYVGTTGLVSAIGDAIDIRGEQGETGATGDMGGSGGDGAPGINGSNGSNGWSPQFAVVSDGARRVLQLTGWTGGSGGDPGSINYYVGTTGLVPSIGDALDIRGPDAGPLTDIIFDGSNVTFYSSMNSWGPFYIRGSDGSTGATGAPGEVTNADLATAIAGTSNNSNAVDTLVMTVSDPPTVGEVQAIADKLDELIIALRR